MKRFFNEKEVTSTLVMDALVSGVRQIEECSRLGESKKVIRLLCLSGDQGCLPQCSNVQCSPTQTVRNLSCCGYTSARRHPCHTLARLC